MYGHTRISIYLSNLIISIIVSILCEAIYVILLLAVGIPLVGGLQMQISQFLMIILNTILIIISFCSIYNFISMICTEITISTTICTLLFIAMFIMQATFGYIASSTKYITNTSIDKNGNKVVTQEPDPNYPGDQKVRQAKIIYFSIPQGQAMEIKNGSSEDLYQMPIYSIILIIIINVLGLFIFSKKELK